MAEAAGVGSARRANSRVFSRLTRVPSRLRTPRLLPRLRIQRCRREPQDLLPRLRDEAVGQRIRREETHPLPFVQLEALVRDVDRRGEVVHEVFGAEAGAATRRTRYAPAPGPSPGTTLTAPAGKPTSLASSAIRSTLSGVCGSGFSTTAQPAASAGASFHVVISRG